jgi:hypothetical protein
VRGEKEPDSERGGLGEKGREGEKGRGGEGRREGGEEGGNLKKSPKFKMETPANYASGPLPGWQLSASAPTS